MDVTFKTELGRFNYRCAGLLIHENKLLVMTDDYSPYYYLPGGRVTLHEVSTDAIIREIKEELNANVEIERLLFIVENFFTDTHYKERYHEIGFYYLVKLSDFSTLPQEDEFTILENGTRPLTFTWKPLEEIKDLHLYPLFIKEHILNLPPHPKHIIEVK